MKRVILPAVWIVLTLASCAGLDRRSASPNDEARTLIYQGDIFFRNGLYEQALVAYQNYLDRFAGDVFSDEALYRSAVVLILEGKEGGDLGEAAERLKTLTRDYPGSSRRPEAQAILLLIEKTGRFQKENAKLRTDLQKLLDIDIRSEEKRKTLQ